MLPYMFSRSRSPQGSGFAEGGATVSPSPFPTSPRSASVRLCRANRNSLSRRISTRSDRRGSASLPHLRKSACSGQSSVLVGLSGPLVCTSGSGSGGDTSRSANTQKHSDYDSPHRSISLGHRFLFARTLPRLRSAIGDYRATYFPRQLMA